MIEKISVKLMNNLTLIMFLIACIVVGSVNVDATHTTETFSPSENIYSICDRLDQRDCMSLPNCQWTVDQDWNGSCRKRVSPFRLWDAGHQFWDWGWGWNPFSYRYGPNPYYRLGYPDFQKKLLRLRQGGW